MINKTSKQDEKKETMFSMMIRGIEQGHKYYFYEETALIFLQYLLNVEIKMAKRELENVKMKGLYQQEVLIAIDKHEKDLGLVMELLHNKFNLIKINGEMVKRDDLAA